MARVCYSKTTNLPAFLGERECDKPELALLTPHAKKRVSIKSRKFIGCHMKMQLWLACAGDSLSWLIPMEKFHD
jgi:hypothetical protein